MRKKIVLIVIIAVVILTVAISLATLNSPIRKARKTSSEFVAMLLAGEASKTYQMFTPQAQQNELLGTWTFSVDKVITYCYNKQANYASGQQTGSLVTLKYKVACRGGNYIFTTTLIDTNKAWEVQSFVSQLQS